MEAETALVGAQGRVELHTVALLDLALALVVLPDDAELDDALGDRDDFESFLVLGVLGEEGGGLEGGDELWCVLVGCVAWVAVHCAIVIDGRRRLQESGHTLPGLLKLRLRHGEVGRG